MPFAAVLKNDYPIESAINTFRTTDPRSYCISCAYLTETFQIFYFLAVSGKVNRGGDIQASTEAVPAAFV